MTGDDKDFLGRWSARKREARERQVEEAAVPETPDETPLAEPAAEKSEAEILEELGLPDPDTLTRGDDFAPFMRAAVPSALRNRALSRLWRTDPVFANLDGLVEYGLDYTGTATVGGNLKTAYRVGRGFLTDDDEEVAAAGEDNATEPPAADAAPEEAAGPVAAGEPGETAGQDASAASDGDAGEPGAGEPGTDQNGEPVAEAGSRPRRMRFSFGEG